MCKTLTTCCVLTATREQLERWQMKLMDYFHTKDIQSAVERSCFLGPRILQENAPQPVFAFCDLELSHKAKHPLLLPTPQAIALFGDHFENISEGFVDLPSFNALSEDIMHLFQELRNKRELLAIRVGGHILKLVQKLPKILEDEEPNSLNVRDIMSKYKDIVDNNKQLTLRRGKLIKAVNAMIIRWIDYEKKGTCNCRLKPAIYQGSGNKLFYGCRKFVTNDKENHCKYGEDLWMSDYKQESRS